MFSSRASEEYQNGVENFLEYCTNISTNLKSIKCPCLECGNTRSMGIRQIRDHLFCNGIDKSYQNWIYHGESKSHDKSLDNDKLGGDDPNPREFSDYDSFPQMFDDIEDEFIDNPNEFEDLLSNAEKLIYPNCSKFTKLSTLDRLFNLKARHGVSNKFFSELLAFLGELLPENNEIPKSFYEARKTLSTMGGNYEKNTRLS